ncbi:MAG: ankyrin repeat domain-containing protein [Myxococcales bacterium]|nr:ankyrin repeat domain-containing protein [Myxococcales bacterium]
MLDPWGLFSAAKSGKVAVVRDALARGFDPNTACEHTGTTALLAACEGEQIAVVRLLLESGANPNVQHRDGFDCWDSARSRTVHEALLRSGFSLVLDATTEASGLCARRLLAPREPMSEEWERTLEGADLFVEVARRDFPRSSGNVRVRVSGASTEIELRPEPASHVTLPAGTGNARVTLTLSGFVGELRLRLWANEVISAKPGPRAFWLPSWTDS